MFKDIFEGQTFYCNHTEDNTICDKCLGNSYKQKKDWEIDFDEWWDNFFELHTSEQNRELIKLIISDLIDETEKQAQSEMRKDLVKWIINYKGTPLTKDLISYLNKIK